MKSDSLLVKINVKKSLELEVLNFFASSGLREKERLKNVCAKIGTGEGGVLGGAKKLRCSAWVGATTYPVAAMNIGDRNYDGDERFGGTCA